MGDKHFKTGWKRKPRGPDGRILPEPVKGKAVEVQKIEEVKKSDSR